MEIVESKGKEILRWVSCLHKLGSTIGNDIKRMVLVESWRKGWVNFSEIIPTSTNSFVEVRIAGELRRSLGVGDQLLEFSLEIISLKAKFSKKNNARRSKQCA